MATYKARNPLAFTPWPVTIITTAVYLALIIPLLVIHLNVPSAPQTSPIGLNLTEAWQDLQSLTKGYHPYNSHQNDKVRSWLLERIDAIKQSAPSTEEYRDAKEEKPDVFVFDDLVSNLTFIDKRRRRLLCKAPTSSSTFAAQKIVNRIGGRLLAECPLAREAYL
jgi:hypothetical protein